MGVAYVLDEPSIGLHQRDNDKLLNTLKHLRDKDLRTVAKSKGVPSTIALTARNIIASKATGGKKKK